MTFTIGGDYIPNDPKKNKGGNKPTIKVQKRKNKITTVVSNLPLDHNEILTLAKEIKSYLGTGGSVKDEEIIIQGNKASEVKAFLKKKSIL